MVFFAICVLAIGQAASDPGPSPAGNWIIDGNGSRGELVIGVDKDGSLHGALYGGPLEGRYDAATKRITIKRMQEKEGSERKAVQAFTGTLAPGPDGKPESRSLVGTFRSVAGPDWGAEGVDYTWKANAIDGTFQAEELKDLAGRWEVLESQTTSAVRHHLPFDSRLVTKGARLEIRGNSVTSDGQLVASMANEIRAPDTMVAGRPSRKPLVFVLPDGSAYLCSYDGRSREGLEIVFPHTIGNVWFGNFIYWKRVED